MSVGVMPLVLPLAAESLPLHMACAPGDVGCWRRWRGLKALLVSVIFAAAALCMEVARLSLLILRSNRHFLIVGVLLMLAVLLGT